MKISILSVFIALVIGTSSCYFDNEEELYAFDNTTCDVSNVTFTTDVNPIIQTHCITGCHSQVNQAAGIVLENYTALKNVVDNNTRFFASINHDAGASPMPKNRPKLPQCDVDKIKSWIDAGAPNN